MRVSMIVLGAVLVAAGLPGRLSGATATLGNCLISLIDEAQVPAEESGVLKTLKVREGEYVKKDQLLGTIDDVLAQKQLDIAKNELDVAKEEAGNDIHVRYAEAAAKVAEAEYRQAWEANEKVPGAVPQAELRRMLLKHRETVLSIEQAEMNLRIAALKVNVGQAQYDAAEESVRRRQITSPLAGMVVKLYRHEGEWVQTVNDPVVMHIVGLDHLRVEGFLNAKDVAPGDVLDQPVSVTVELAHGRRESVQGKVVFVSPLVQAGGDYQVWAEVENRADGGYLLLRPGLDAEMTITLKK